MIVLREDQTETLDRVRDLLRAGVSSVALRAATGFGKTVIASKMLGNAAEKGMRSLFICHRRELVKQASRTFEAVGIEHGIIASSFDPNLAPLVQIASIGTLQHRVNEVREPRLIVWDECHHASAEGWARIRAEFPNAFHIGLTATPIRLDGRPLNFEAMVCAPSERFIPPWDIRPVLFGARTPTSSGGFGRPQSDAYPHRSLFHLNDGPAEGFRAW